MNRVINFFIKNKKYTFLFFTALGIILIGISVIPKQETNSVANAETIYTQNLENRTREIIEKITGKGTTDVMITLKNTYTIADKSTLAFSSYKTENDAVFKTLPTPSIAGVMIVCTSLENYEDFLTVKKAVSVCLDIPQSKIYIIGGTTDNEKNIQ